MVDQVARKLAFEEAHPEVTITPPPDTYGRWSASWEQGRESVMVTAGSLRDLLDELDKRFASVP